MTLQLLYLKVFGLSRNDSNMTTWGVGGVLIIYYYGILGNSGKQGSNCILSLVCTKP